MFKLFRQPEPDETAVIGADPADGGSDYCAAVAKSKKNGDSFLIFHARMDSAQFGYELNKMGQFIYKSTGHYPMIAVERNTGGSTINTLQLLNYPQLFRMPRFGIADIDGEENKIGWITNTLSRPKMLDDLSLSLRQKVNTIYDKETIQEMMAFIRKQSTGRPEAAPGSHDDLVIAEAIAWQVYTLAPATLQDGLQARVNLFPKQDLFDDNGVPV